MKKLIFLGILAVMGINTSNGQGDFRLGVNAGLPIGNAADHTSFQLGADVAYMVELANIAAVGPMVGYSHFFGDSGEEGEGIIRVNVDKVQFVPIAVSGRFDLLSLALGLDLGYALGLNDVESGFYYRPQVGFNVGPVGLIASYQGISMEGSSFSSVNLGVEFGL